MAAALREAGFKSSKADPDAWMQKAMKPDSFEHWEHVLICIDDIFAIGGDPKATTDHHSSKCTLKEDSVEEPDSCLGAKIFKWWINGADDLEKGTLGHVCCKPCQDGPAQC